LKFNDSRSFKVMVLADYFVNPQSYPGLPNTRSVYEAVRDSGFGVIKMPPAGISEPTAAAWVSSVCDQIQEYTNRDFGVLVLGFKPVSQGGVWLSQLRRELKRRKVGFPPTKVLTEAEVTSEDGTARVKRFLKTEGLT
jgi:hypothetical protein